MDISVIVTNWNRQHFLSDIAKQMNEQKFPKDRYEVIFVDDDSVEKDEVYSIFKKIRESYPKMNLKFIETHFCKTQNPAFRYNVGVRHACGKMIILNESDILQQGEYLSNVYEYLSKDPNLYLSPTVYHVKESGEIELENLRFETDLGSALMRIHFEKVHGYDENVSGWGGIEGDFINRVKTHCNLRLYPRAKGLVVYHHGWTFKAKPYFAKMIAKPGSGPRNWGPPKSNSWGLSDKVEVLSI